MSECFKNCIEHVDKHNKITWWNGNCCMYGIARGTLNSYSLCCDSYPEKNLYQTLSEAPISFVIISLLCMIAIMILFLSLFISCIRSIINYNKQYLEQNRANQSLFEKIIV